MKAKKASDVIKFKDIPNVGPAVADDFILLDIKEPQDLVGKDGYVLYRELCRKTKTRHDPCVLDTFLAVTDFMNGAEAKPWYSYTASRKVQYPDI